jgi:DNA invertase Pin-like site-specific DNA recombinase
LRQLREYCKARNLAIATEYVEPAATATDDRRPAFQQMIADATQPPVPVEAIVVHSRSRFFRNLFEFLQYERILKKVGIKIVSISQEASDDAAGEMARKLFSLFDEYQSLASASGGFAALRTLRRRHDPGDRQERTLPLLQVHNPFSLRGQNPTRTPSV